MGRDSELDLAQNAMSEIAKEILKQDTIVTIRHDFATRYDDIVDAKDWVDREMPVIDDKHNTLGRDNAFWLKVRTRDRADVIGTGAVRIYRDTTMRQLFTDNRLLYDCTKPAGDHSVSLETYEADHVAGTLAWIGSGWIHPDYRRRHIPALLLGFMQALLILDYDVTYSFATIHHKHAETGLGVRSYRFHHHHQGIKWHWPNRGDLDVWLLYNNRHDIISELKLFLPKPPEVNVLLG